MIDAAAQNLICRNWVNFNWCFLIGALDNVSRQFSPHVRVIGRPVHGLAVALEPSVEAGRAQGLVVDRHVPHNESWSIAGPDITVDPGGGWQGGGRGVGHRQLLKTMLTVPATAVAATTIVPDPLDVPGLDQVCGVMGSGTVAGLELLQLGLVVRGMV